MPTTEKTNTSKSAKILYQPFGLVTSVLAGLIAGQIVKRIWMHAAPGHPNDPPKPLQSEYSVKEVLAAAAVHGAVFAVVKAVVSRGGARAYERWTGDWPGN